MDTRAEFNPSLFVQVQKSFKKEKVNLKKESEIYADYIKNDNDEFVVECALRERKEDLINIKMIVPTKELARIICDNWRTKSTDVYQSLLNELWNS